MSPSMCNRRRFLIGSAALTAGCAHFEPQADLAELEQVLGGRIGFCALDTGNGRRIDWRSGERFALCSTFKAALAAAVLTRVDAGELRRNDSLTFDAANLLANSRATAQRRDGRISVIEACEAVVSVSDNTAANALLKLVGGPPAMTAFFRSLGDRATRLDRYELELNSNIDGDPRDTTTPEAMLRSLQTLLLGDALSDTSRGLLTDWMLHEQNGRARIRARCLRRGRWRTSPVPARTVRSTTSASHGRLAVRRSWSSPTPTLRARRLRMASTPSREPRGWPCASSTSSHARARCQSLVSRCVCCSSSATRPSIPPLVKTR
jgi:hypothetical protein